MNQLVLDRQAMHASFTGVPHGYVLPNGVVVIWKENHCNNVYPLEKAMAMFPTLVLIEENKPS